MFKSNSTKWIVSLVVVALIIVVGVTVRIDNHTFTSQTAIGQTSENFSQDFEYLERANRAFIEAVNRAKPAVVQVTTTKLVSVRRPQSPFDLFDDEDFFHHFFGPRERRERRDSDEREEDKREVGGRGSGVIVSKDGYILTNNHVIEGAEDIQVILPDGEKYHAKVIGRDAGDQGTDLAILKIDGENLPVLPVGDSEALQVGEWVIAIGSPFGFAQTVTRGMVSAKGRSDIGIVQYADFIQTDAAINRGNSGGALINIRGELIGINTAIATGGFSQGNAGIGFAISINLAKRIMTQLIEKGEVERGWLGVSLQSINYDLAEKLKLGEPQGALVRMVGKGMPAAKGGVRHGDVIVEFDNVRIRDVKHLRGVVAATDVGRTVEVKVIRKGKEKVLKVKLEKRTQAVVDALTERPPRFVSNEENGQAFAGLHVRDLTSEWAARYGFEGETGVLVVSVEQRSSAAEAGIRKDDLIQEIEDMEIANVREYQKRIKEVKDESLILLVVRRRETGTPQFVTLRNKPRGK